ncbi:ATP-binding protein [Beggiatoa alba]|nr:ATP-binding protein [Beggiatoa alba]
MNTFSTKFNEHIEYLGVTNQKLSQVLGVHHTTIARWRKDSEPETPTPIKMFAKHYRLPDEDTEELLNAIKFTYQGDTGINIEKKGNAQIPSSQIINPFIVGTPVKRGQFFGREDILRNLFNLWRDYPQQPIQNAAIYGEKRIGKTSLLFQIRDLANFQTTDTNWRDTQKNYEWLLPKQHSYNFIYVDFQNPQMGFRKKLLEHILKNMRLESSENLVLSEQNAITEFYDILSEKLKAPTIVLFDEINAAVSHPSKELDNYFWESLRSISTTMFDTARLGFVIASTETPSKLSEILDKKTISSPFFNIFGYQIEMPVFSKEEALELMEQSPIVISADDKDFILEKSQLHPLKLQVLCRQYVDAYRNNSVEKWRDFNSLTE